MDSNYNQKPRRQVMAAAALMLGISSVFFFQTVFLPFILGGTAIVLAVLSKGYTKKMPGTAKVAVTFAAGGITIASAIIGVVFYLIFCRPDILIGYGRQYDQTYEQIYGSPTSDVLGASYEEIMNQYITVFKDALKGIAYDD